MIKLQNTKVIATMKEKDVWTKSSWSCYDLDITNKNLNIWYLIIFSNTIEH